MQRSATTWLWRRLRAHPEVYSLTFKEVVFFSGSFATPNRPGSELRDQELGASGELYWKGPTRSLLHYRGLFAAPKPVRIDFSPSYGELPEASVAQVQAILGSKVKIILSVRDPVERTWSNFKYNLGYTGEHPLAFSFAQRVAAYRNVATLRRCDYASVVAVWRRFFEDLKVVFMDDLVAAPTETLNDIAAFLGLSAWEIDAAATPVNTTDVVDMPAEDRVFLFGLHQATYDAAETALGGAALHWRRRQQALIEA